MKVSLREVSESIKYGLTASATIEDTGYKFLRITDIANGSVDFNTVPNVELDRRDLPRYQLEFGDIVIARTGASTGASSYFMGPENVVFASYLVRFRIKPTANSRFVSYVLRSETWKDFIYANAFAKSAQPNLSANSMSGFEFDLPDFETQRAIADVLGALDDKIAANQRVINAQDVLVQSLVRRENQAGVCIRLDDIAKSVSRGVAPKYTDDGSLVVNQRCIRNQAVDLTAARTLSNLPENKAKRLEPSDVLINSTGVGTLGRAARWIERIPDATADSHVSIVKFDERKVDPEFAGVVLTSMEKQIEDLAEGTTGQTELRRDLLSGLPLQLPRIKVQRQVGAQIRQFDASKRALEKENQVLAATRDELLPLLMNGKITVAEAKEVAGGVGVVKQNQQEEGDSSV